MRREAHYVAALMWEEGAGERWGGRGRDEGNGASEARRTARGRFRRWLLGSACSVWVEASGGRDGKGMDGRSKIHSLRGPVFDNSSIHHRSAQPIPGKQKSPVEKRKK